MTDIAPIGSTRTIRAATAAYARQPEEQAVPEIRRGTDQVEVSELATYLSKIRQLPVRQELVDSVREKIARGDYETPDRIDATVDEILKDL